MTVSIDTLKEHVGKSVVLTVRQEDGSIEKLEGKIEAASEVGVGFKPKRKRDMDLLEPDSIEELKAAPTKPSQLRQKKLFPVGESKVRAHLIDRHGAPLSQVNGMSNDEAIDLHNKIDHSDFGYNHEKTESTSDGAEPDGE